MITNNAWDVILIQYYVTYQAKLLYLYSINLMHYYFLMFGYIFTKYNTRTQQIFYHILETWKYITNIVK